MSYGTGKPLTTPVIGTRGHRARKGILKRRAKGFTLIEIVLVITVGLGLIIGGIVFYNMAANKAQIAEDINRLRSISTDMHAIYKQVDRSQLPTNSTVFTNDFRRKTGLPSSALTKLSHVTSSGNEWVVQIRHVSQDECEKLQASGQVEQIALYSRAVWSCSGGYYTVYFRKS